MGVDPLAEETDAMSPYVAMNNDPVLNVDPMGLQARTMSTPRNEETINSVGAYYQAMAIASMGEVRDATFNILPLIYGSGASEGQVTLYGTEAQAFWALLTGQKYVTPQGTATVNNLADESGNSEKGDAIDYSMIDYNNYAPIEGGSFAFMPQKGALMANNLYKGYGGQGDPVSTAFWNSYDEFFLSITPGLNMLNAASETFTGKNLAGVEFQPPSAFEASSPVGKVGKVSKIATVEDQAVAISERIGKNSITIGTPTKQIRYDLIGKAHAGLPTPHVQVYNKHFYEGAVRSITRASKFAYPLTQQEIRIIRNYLKSLK